MPADEARIPATDDGVLHGDGVFEALRLYFGRPFALDEHLERMTRSASNLLIEFDSDAIREDIEALLQATAGEPGHDCLRLIVTGSGRRLLFTESLSAIVTAPTVRLATVTYEPTRILDGVKSLSYAANMLASLIARDQGADEALLVTTDGRVLEAPTSSFFWVARGELLTPPLSDHILASITRQTLLRERIGRERTCTLADLGDAEEAFIASTTREVQSVAAIDGRELATAPGPFTEMARSALRAAIARDVGSRA